MKRLKWKKAEPPDFKSVPEKPGIYIISTRQEVDHKYEVKYVGQGDNLRTCANHHWSKKEKNKDLREHIAEKYVMKFNYAEVPSKSERAGMTLYIRILFSPPYNSPVPPKVKGVECTIPAVRKPFPDSSIVEYSKDSIILRRRPPAPKKKAVPPTKPDKPKPDDS